MIQYTEGTYEVLIRTWNGFEVQTRKGFLTELEGIRYAVQPGEFGGIRVTHVESGALAYMIDDAWSGVWTPENVDDAVRTAHALVKSMHPERLGAMVEQFRHCCANVNCANQKTRKPLRL